MKNKVKILAIDDNPGTLDYIKIVLKKEGYEVYTALTGAAGLEEFSANTPDLVLLDIKLPGEDAMEILEKMREQNSGIPIAILTGYGYDAETITKAKGKGAAEYILKTAPLDTLKFRINKLLKKYAHPKIEDKEHIPNILVIDDDEGVCKVIKGFLEKSGYNVIATTDPRKTMEIVRKERISLIFLDIAMPGRNGLEVLGDIKKFNKNIPVIMISGVKDDDIIAVALKEGADDYITKPFSLEQVKAMVIKNILE
ncbi:MAG: response regulator [Candidatus Omnitrophota bacterium]|nr:response regulator [Candidatus Omnitrophota bacterium]